MLRYLLLYLEGGIYTDTDTVLLKSPSHWGRTPNLWRNGAGWLDDDLLKRIEEGVPPENVLPLPSVIVGIEADVGGREDWHDWWPRPVSRLPCFDPPLSADANCAMDYGIRPISSYSPFRFTTDSTRNSNCGRLDS